jgi:hypothetical protein
MCLNLFFQQMVIEMLFDNKFVMNFFFNYIIMYSIEGILLNIFLFFHLDRLSIRYEGSNLRFCIMFK